MEIKREVIMQGKEIIRLAQAVNTLAHAVIVGLLFVAAALSSSGMRFGLVLLAWLFLFGMFGNVKSQKKERRYYGLYVEEDKDE
jgi:hypothetical protein